MIENLTSFRRALILCLLLWFTAAGLCRAEDKEKEITSTRKTLAAKEEDISGKKEEVAAFSGIEESFSILERELDEFAIKIIALKNEIVAEQLKSIRWKKATERLSALCEEVHLAHCELGRLR